MEDDERSHQDTIEPPYGRVTNAARFALLHSVALELLDRLHHEFDVERIEPYEHAGDLDPFARVPLARSTIAIVPVDRECAPIVVAFSSFPGLLVRAGRAYQAVFPSCGCDACAETGDGEADRFQRLVQAVITGRFREYVKSASDGSATVVWEGESDGRRWREQQLWLESGHGLIDELRSLPRWKPWRVR